MENRVRQQPAPGVVEIQLRPGDYRYPEASEHILPVQFPALFERKPLVGLAGDDLLVPRDGILLDSTANLGRDAGRKKICYVIETAAHRAQLPIDQRNTVRIAVAEEHIVQPEISVNERLRSVGHRGRMFGEMGTIGFCKPTRVR